MWRANSLEKTMMLGKIEGRRGGWQRMWWLDGITISTDTVWVSSGRWQRTGKPVALCRTVCCRPWAHRSDTAVWLDNNNKAWTPPISGTLTTLQVLETSLAQSSAPFWKSYIHVVISLVSFITVLKTPLFNEVEPYLQLQTLKNHYFSHLCF